MAVEQPNAQEHPGVPHGVLNHTHRPGLGPRRDRGGHEAPHAPPDRPEGAHEGPPRGLVALAREQREHVSIQQRVDGGLEDHQHREGDHEEGVVCGGRVKPNHNGGADYGEHQH
ncbi:unnamed protein product [Phytomonas sp. EM1]|nr:unnamed protein product [Phytomonas sp. EM1]|eukprot:CCW63131.1 unnamed protein product [Phytomonas sp. isolate EM1]